MLATSSSSRAAHRKCWQTCLRRMPCSSAEPKAARICISAIALETLGAAIAALTARGLTAEVTQIAVSRTKPAGRLHLLMANNPIFLITGTRK